MKTILLLIAFTTAAFAQQETNKLTIIPAANGSAQGAIVLQGLTRTAQVNIDTPAAGVLNLGDGTVGHKNAQILLGGVNVGGLVITGTGSYGADDGTGLQAAICSLPTAGGTVEITHDVVLAASVDNCSSGTPKSHVHVTKKAGVAITPGIFTIFGVASIGTGEEHYEYGSNFVNCADCANGVVNTSGTSVSWVSGLKFDSSWVGLTVTIPSTSGTTFTIATVPSPTSMTLTASAGTQLSVSAALPRPWDQPVVIIGRSDSLPGFQQTDTAFLIGRSTSDSLGPSSQESRDTLSVHTDYSGATGTIVGIESILHLYGNTSSKGSGPLIGYAITDSATTSAVSGTWGICSVGGPGICTGNNAELNTGGDVAGTLYGHVVLELPDAADQHSTFIGYFGGLGYNNPALTLTDVVTNGTSTVTSATGGFTSAMVGSYASMPARGMWQVATYVDTHTITIGDIPGGGSFNPPSGTGLTAYVGANPFYGALLNMGGGHQQGGLKITESGGYNDFYAASFESSKSEHNIVQLVNNNVSNTSNTGFDNQLQFWHGEILSGCCTLGDTRQAMIQGMSGVETGRITSDLTTNGDVTQGHLDIGALIAGTVTNVARFDVDGLTLPLLSAGGSGSTVVCADNSSGTLFKGGCGSGGANSIDVSPTNPLLLYCHFRDDDSSSLYCDYSRDFLNYRPVRKSGQPFGEPIRDPSTMWDGTTFWFLASPNNANCLVQIWSSTDLQTFSAITTIDLSSNLSSCNGAWAPEWHPKESPPTGTLGFLVQLTNDSGTTQHPFFFAYDPNVGGTPTPTAFTISSSAATQTFDMFPYYDATNYWITYVDHVNDGGCTDGFCQKIAYAKASTLTGTYAQQTPADSSTSVDHFGFGRDAAEAPSVIPLANSMALYGQTGCLRVYADTWIKRFGGWRQYTWKYVDTCSFGSGDPFAVVMQADGWPAPNASGVAVASVGSSASLGVTSISLAGLGGPGSHLHAGDVFQVDGYSYTIMADVAVSSGTATVSISPWLQSNIASADAVTSSIATPVNISASEQGTVIAITDQSSANIVYKAEDAYSNERAMQGRQVIGGGAGPFTLTINSRFDTGFLAYDESPTIGLGGLDAGDSHGYSYATWSSCGLSAVACPVPIGGDARWISQYGGTSSVIQLNNTNTDLAESSILYAQGLTQFGGSPMSGSSLAKKALWSAGNNNVFLGPNPSGGNIANNWYFFYDAGLGPLAGTNPTVANPGFETGSLSSWATAGGGSAVTSPVHSGLYAASITTGSGNEVHQVVSGLTSGTTYDVTGWVYASSGMSSGGIQLYVDNASSGNSRTSSLFNPSQQWYQIGLQYTADSTGQVYVSFRNTSNVTIYVDDMQAYVWNSPIGGFPLSISPSTGEVRANWGITLGSGDSSALGTTDNASISAPSAGLLYLGNGTIGDHSASELLGTFNAGNNHTPAFDDSFATGRLEYFGGATANTIGPGMIFAQQYNSSSPGTITLTGGIYGYKQAADGTRGGGLALYTMPSGGTSMTKGAILDDVQVFTTLNGYGSGPLTGAYGNLYTPSAGVWNMGNGSGGDTSAEVHMGRLGIGTTAPLNALVVAESGNNDVMLVANTVGSAKAYIDFLTYNGIAGGTVSARIGAVDVGSFNSDLVFETANSGVATGTTAELVRIEHTGKVDFLASVDINNPSPIIDLGNKLEIKGVTGVVSGYAYSSAISTAGVETYWGSANSAGTDEGFMGTFNNYQFTIRQNNADVIKLPTSGGVAVTGNLDVGSGVYQIESSGTKNGVTNSISCSTTTIQYKDWSGTNQSATLCFVINSNGFIGGIKTN